VAQPLDRLARVSGEGGVKLHWKEVGHWANGECPLFGEGQLANEALRLSETLVTHAPDCFYCSGNGVQPNGVECPLGCSPVNQ
jgi:hypothetical protein